MDNEAKYCNCCGRKLNDAKTDWLELSFRTNVWYLPGECPQDESQGCFPFGKACARKTLRDQPHKPT